MTSLTEEPLYWTLRAIARLERRGDVRGPRLTEPDLLRWNRVRRQLGAADFIALLHEDLAGPFPTPFDLDRWQRDPRVGLGESKARELIAAAIAEDEAAPAAFLRQACRALGLPAGGDIADLPKVQPHQRALELPGTGGRVALRQALDHGVAIDRNVDFVADTDAERLAIGLAVVEVRANAPTIWSSAASIDRADRPRYDHVFGVRGHAAAEAWVARAGLEARWT